MESITITKFSTRTVFRIFSTAFFSGLFPLFCVVGVLAYFDLVSLTWQERPVHGLDALWVGPLMGLVFALFATIILGSISAFGLWLYSKIGMLKIEYQPSDGSERPIN